MGCSGCGGGSSNSTSNTNVSLGEKQINDLIIQASWYLANVGYKLDLKKSMGELCEECMKCLFVHTRMLELLRCYVYPVAGTIVPNGGTATSWEVYVNGVLIGTASFLGTATQKVVNMAAAINAFISAPDYKAHVVGTTLYIEPVIESTGIKKITIKPIGGTIPDAVITNIIQDGCFKLTEIKYIVDYLSKLAYK